MYVRRRVAIVPLGAREHSPARAGEVLAQSRELRKVGGKGKQKWQTWLNTIQLMQDICVIFLFYYIPFEPSIYKKFT